MVETPSHDFVILSQYEAMHEVFMVGADGVVVMGSSYFLGSKKCSHIAIDRDGHIFVADCSNAMLVLLGSTLRDN